MAGKDYDVIIIGSGVGGLSAGAILAREGLRVLVLEQGPRTGGCCSNYNENGFRPETGAGYVICEEVLYGLFELLGLRLEDHLDLRPVETPYDLIFDDGSRVLLPGEPEEIAEVVASISPGDVEGYYRYCADMNMIHGSLLSMLEPPLPDIRQLSSLSTFAGRLSGREQLQALPISLRLAASSLQKTTDSYFRHEKVRLLFSWKSTFSATPPYRSNGLFSLPGYPGGANFHYPRGGMESIPKALGIIIERSGGEVRTGVTVAKITVEGGNATGVKIAGGDLITSRAVVSNAHSRITYLDLVGLEHLPYHLRRAVKRQPCSMPTPAIHLGLNCRLDSIRAQSTAVLPGRAVTDSFWHLYYNKGLLSRPDDTPFLVNSASQGDRSLAPPGKQVLSAVSIAPYRLKHHEWDDLAEQWAGECIASLERRAFPGLGSVVEWIDPVTPVEMERRLKLPGGGSYGLEMSMSNLGPFRPGWRSPAVEGLYLTGQCTNPGAGLPGVMISGMIASSCLLNDWTGGLD